MLVPESDCTILLRPSRELPQASYICFFDFATFLANGSATASRGDTGVSDLEPVGNVTIDLRNQGDAVIEDVDRLFRVQRSLAQSEVSLRDRSTAECGLQRLSDTRSA